MESLLKKIILYVNLVTSCAYLTLIYVVKQALPCTSAYKSEQITFMFILSMTYLHIAKWNIHDPEM